MSLGGGVLIAFAAVLWLLYLAPAWLQRRRFLATERTAVRLQQTLRILAETAEVPDEVRAELSARSVAEQHRALRDAARHAEGRAGSRRASAERALARRQRPPREPRRRAEAVQAIAAARLRRSRVLAGAVLVGSLGVAGFGVARELRTGDWLLTVAGGIGVLAALALLQRAATVAAAHRAVEAVDRAVAVPEPVGSFTDWAAAPDGARPTWTPVPLPKPLYLDRAEASAEAREGDAAASLAAASARSEQALRAAQAAAHASVRSIGPATEAVHVALGIQDTQPMLPDVDAVLRRRRAG